METVVESAAHRTFSDSDDRSLLLRTRITLWVFAVVLGLVQLSATRNTMNVDGISYLDMADNYLRYGWAGLVNGHWSPLYPWLLAAAIRIIRPSPYWEFAVLHLVNFVAYLAALMSFDFMLHELIACQREISNDNDRHGPLPRWAVVVVGYSLFLWSSLTLIGIKQESPDMLMSIFVYLATAIILKIRQNSESYFTFLGLGTALGFGYLAKAPMFPLSFLFLGIALFLVPSWKKAVPRAVLAFAIFLLVSAFLFIPLSRSKRHFTFGESAKLNQLWNINDAGPHWYWQSLGTARGKFSHPPQRIFDFPPVYEFSGQPKGTQPVWYDPSYWIEGSVATFQPRKQLTVFLSNLGFYSNILLTDGAPFTVALLFLFFWNVRRNSEGLWQQWPTLVPVLAALLMYALVHVETRYLGVFLAILGTGLLASIRVPTNLSVKVAFATALAIVVSVGVPMTLAAYHDIYTGIRHRPHPQWQVGQTLQKLGVQPGDLVARIGGTFGADWARLSRTRVIAEVPRGAAPLFWSSSPTVQAQVIQALRKTGAKAVVAEQIPPYETFVPTSDWRRAGNTDFYVLLLKSGSDSTGRRSSTIAGSTP